MQEVILNKSYRLAGTNAKYLCGKTNELGMEAGTKSLQNKLYYLPAAGRQIPKITHIARAVCLPHFTDVLM